MGWRVGEPGRLRGGRFLRLCWAWRWGLRVGVTPVRGRGRWGQLSPVRSGVGGIAAVLVSHIGYHQDFLRKGANIAVWLEEVANDGGQARYVIGRVRRPDVGVQAQDGVAITSVMPPCLLWEGGVFKA